MKRIHVFFALLLILVVTAAFGAQAEAFVIEHPLGTVTIERMPQNVVVFDYGILDALDVLGVDVAGVPGSNLPSFLSKFGSPNYVNVGTLFEPDFEKVYALNPDLIIISSRQATQYDELNRIAPTLYVEIDNSNWWGSVQKNLNLLGQIFGLEAEVKKTLMEFQETIDSIQSRASSNGLEALILMANDGALSVYGAESRFGIIHQDFGFAPADTAIENATHGQNISFEYLVRINPQIIFVVDRAAIAGGSVSARQVLDNPLVKMTNAYKNDQIIYLESQSWYVVSGGIRSTQTMMNDIEQAFK